jgi:ribonuclease HII
MIVGVDEVGRGCWAGPVVAGAVLWDETATIKGLKDSKKLSKMQRERLDAEIRVVAVAFGIGWVMPEELDAIGLTEAVRLAMHRAVACITGEYTKLIVDGNYNYFPESPKASTLIGGDNLLPAISAASIIAKVARDRFMAEQARTFPGYGFEAHVGYGTAAHSAALRAQGLCALHRRCFKPIQAYI